MEGCKYSICPGCEALLVGTETDCPNCGTMLWSGGAGNAPPPHGPAGEPYIGSDARPYYEYAVYVAVTAEELGNLLNNLALQGWEPINVYGGTIQERPDETTHFAVMRRHNA
jgi:hypothetical protein